jgi:hypothetical protein
VVKIVVDSGHVGHVGEAPHGEYTERVLLAIAVILTLLFVTLLFVSFRSFLPSVCRGLHGLSSVFLASLGLSSAFRSFVQSVFLESLFPASLGLRMASLSIDSLFRYFVPSVFLVSLGLRCIDSLFLASLFLASLGLRGLNGLASLGDAEHDGALQRYYGDAELGCDVCSVNRSVSGVGVLDHDARKHSADGAEPRRRDAVHSVLFFFLF